MHGAGEHGWRLGTEFVGDEKQISGTKFPNDLFLEKNFDLN